MPVPTSAIRLPGPTGESNTLEFHPRGVVLCVARDERTLVAQAKAALALGNKVMMLRAPCALAARDRLEPVEVVLTDKVDPATVDVVLLDASADRARRVRAEFAASGGPIIPIVECRRDGHCDWTRLVVERTLTVNTAAAGGNAALLSLSEDTA
jgi:RHH-type proline utilization regulon transcriptional repressor/proline dehydrogenase/delta 1-pyrroline-5-carboxylate dehydrogenase